MAKVQFVNSKVNKINSWFIMPYRTFEIHYPYVDGSNEPIDRIEIELQKFGTPQVGRLTVDNKIILDNKPLSQLRAKAEKYV